MASQLVMLWVYPCCVQNFFGVCTVAESDVCNGVLIYYRGYDFVVARGDIGSHPYWLTTL